MARGAKRSGRGEQLREIEAVGRLARCLFPRAARLRVERVREGVSTRVYRVRRDDAVFYLRVLPEEGASFAPEARVHRLLRERDVKVPEVVYFEHRHEAIGRSVMVTTEIPGGSIGRRGVERDLAGILAEAGRGLAIVNGIGVEGFGWIVRDGSEVGRLTAEQPTYRAAFLEPFEEDVALLAAGVLEPGEVAALRGLVARDSPRLDVERGVLAHGDFEATHIYQQDGRYSGIIDFGEIRGADRHYDLGHFLLHDGQALPRRVLLLLLAGYAGVAPLPADHERRIRCAALLIGIGRLARLARKRPADFRAQPYYAWLRGKVRELLA